MFQSLATSNDDHGPRILCNLAKLILIEGSKAQDSDHVPAMVELLAENGRERESSLISRSIVARAERILEKLWRAEDARAAVLNILSQSLSLEAERRDEHASELAWAAAKFLIEHGEIVEPGLADIVITIGLERRSRHPEAFLLLKALVGDSSLGPRTVGMLRNGLLNTDADVRAGCLCVLVDLGLISGAADGRTCARPRLRQPTRHRCPVATAEIRA